MGLFSGFGKAVVRQGAKAARKGKSGWATRQFAKAGRAAKGRRR